MLDTSLCAEYSHCLTATTNLEKGGALTLCMCYASAVFGMCRRLAGLMR